MSSSLSRPVGFALVLIITLIAVPSLNVRARPAEQPFVTANGIALQQNLALPILSLQPLTVTNRDTAALANRLEGLGASQFVGSDEYQGLPRFTVPNTDTASLFTQYTATGGFYAFDLDEIGREDARGEVDVEQAKLLACQFLLQNGFIDPEGNLLRTAQSQTPQGVRILNPGGCNFAQGQSPGYEVSTIQAATVSATTPNAAPTIQTIGASVVITMAVPLLRQSLAPSIPLGGPGGHISLLFSTTQADKGPSLDNSVPGLGAVAMPFYGRGVELGREVPIRNPDELMQEVEKQVRASIPGATSVRMPQPELFYYIEEAGVPQSTAEPVLNLSGIEVTVGDETIILRDLTVPLLQGGPEGFGPTVSITSPANGSAFTPGAEVTIQGQIADGVAPYSVAWLGPDGELLGEGTQNAAGSVQLKTKVLPALGKDGLPQPIVVTLRVTDNEGATREASVTLTPSRAPAIYLPLVAQTLAEGGAAPARATAQDISIAQASHSFGIEANWDYPPAGSGGADLPGVKPDANGLKSGLAGYGYAQRFYWSNASAWEKDWRDCSLGGADCTYGVDRADYVYYAGHGAAGGISMASSHDSTWFSGSDARYQTLRWIGFASCQTLRVQGYTSPNEPIRRWFGAFRGAHLLTGFNSNMRDVAFGGPLASNMRIPKLLGIEFPWAQQTIAQAWVTTAFSLNAGKPAYIYARGTNGANPINDKLPKPGSPAPARPFPVASYHWVWWNE